MLILLFVVVPLLVVAAYALAQGFRNRQPSSIESGVDAFRREMDALSPHAAPMQRRPGERAQGERPDGDRPAGPSAPRRPGAGGPSSEPPGRGPYQRDPLSEDPD